MGQRFKTFASAEATTKESVIDLLGEPDQRMDDLHVFSYTWTQAPWKLVFIGPGAAGTIGNEPHYCLFVAFDAEGHVVAHDIVRRTFYPTPRQKARQWLKKQGLSVPDPIGSCNAVAAPDDLAVLYVLRPGGWQDYGLFKPSVTLRNLSDTESDRSLCDLVGFLEEGNCLSVLLKPGPYNIFFDPDPNPFTLISESDAPFVYVPIQAENGQRIFVKVAVHSGGWDGRKVIAEKITDVEAQTELAKCKPTCVDNSGKSTFCLDLSGTP